MRVEILFFSILIARFNLFSDTLFLKQVSCNFSFWSVLERKGHKFTLLPSHLLDSFHPESPFLHLHLNFVYISFTFHLQIIMMRFWFFLSKPLPPPFFCLRFSPFCVSSPPALSEGVRTVPLRSKSFYLSLSKKYVQFLLHLLRFSLSILFSVLCFFWFNTYMLKLDLLFRSYRSVFFIQRGVDLLYEIIFLQIQDFLFCIVKIQLLMLLCLKKKRLFECFNVFHSLLRLLIY